MYLNKENTPKQKAICKRLSLLELGRILLIFFNVNNKKELAEFTKNAGLMLRLLVGEIYFCPL